jgi:hypothetical protein
MSEKQKADAANNYVLNDDVLDEIQYFKHKQSTITHNRKLNFKHTTKTFIAGAWRERIINRNT